MPQLARAATWLPNANANVAVTPFITADVYSSSTCARSVAYVTPCRNFWCVRKVQVLSDWAVRDGVACRSLPGRCCTITQIDSGVPVGAVAMAAAMDEYWENTLTAMMTITLCQCPTAC